MTFYLDQLCMSLRPQLYPFSSHRHRSGMVYDDAEVLYAEVKRDGKQLIDDALKAILDKSVPLSLNEPLSTSGPAREDATTGDSAAFARGNPPSLPSVPSLLYPSSSELVPEPLFCSSGSESSVEGAKRYRRDAGKRGGWRRQVGKWSLDWQCAHHAECPGATPACTSQDPGPLVCSRLHAATALPASCSVVGSQKASGPLAAVPFRTLYSPC